MNLCALTAAVLLLLALLAHFFIGTTEYRSLRGTRRRRSMARHGCRDWPPGISFRWIYSAPPFCFFFSV